MPSGYIYSWTGKVSSSYGTAGNWYNTTAGATATAVPGLNDEAIIVAAGTIAGPGSAFELGLSGSGTGLSVQGTLYGTYDYVGGTVTLLSGAALASPNLIDIGDNSSATIASKVPTVLTVQAGAYLSATNPAANTFDVEIGQSGGNGTLAVNGGIASAGKTAGFWVGNGGTGVISVTAGGQIQSGTAAGTAVKQIDLALGSAGGSGTLLVSGANSLADFTNTVEVGFGGSGLLSVSSGGVLEAGEGLDSLNIGDVYSGAIGNGVVDIDASTAYLAGVMEVGAYGQGSLNVSNGGYVDAYFYLSGQAPSWSALIAANAGSSGTLSLSTGSTMLASEGIAVGSAGAGVLDVVSNATLSIYAQAATGTVALDAGVSSGAVGTVDVSGGLIDDVGQAGMVIGGAGSGSMTISQLGSLGGRVLTGGGVSGVALTVGASSGSTGNIAISGSLSGLGVYGELADGAGGTGTVSVSGGARLVVTTAATASALVLGGSGGNGALSVSGPSLLSVTGQTDVGEFGPGALSITDGGGFVGQASALAALAIGASAGATGSVLVSDAYSYASLSGGINVGNQGSGTLTVQDQASLVVSGTTAPTVPAVIIAAGEGSNGTVTLASLAEMTVLSAGVDVGAAGDGVLSVDSATLTVTTSPGVGVSALNVGVSAGSVGTVNVAGGVIDDTQSAGVIIGDGGSGTLTISQVGAQGGLVETGDPSGAAGLAVGVGSGSTGSVSISGSASGLGVYGTAAIGTSGSGDVAVTDGGHLVVVFGPTESGLVLGGNGGRGTLSLASGAQAYVVGQSVVGQLGTGVLSITGGSSFTGTASGVPAMVIGAASTATGSVLISDGSTYVPLTGGLVVGSSGVGSLAVENSAVLAVYGSTAPNLAGLFIGEDSTSSGTVLLASGGELIAGTGIAVGDFGTGVLDVSGGTLVSSLSPSLGIAAIDVGASVDAVGVMSVAGGLVEDTQSAGVIIGDIGAGSLAITQVGSVGGTLLTGNTTSSTGFLLGNAGSGTGSVAVSGSASGLGVYGASVIGASGAGTLSLSGGARFVTGIAANSIGLVMGANVGGTGAMAVSGAAEVSVLGQTDVGQSGSGSLSVTGGSSLTDQSVGAPALVVAKGSGSTGNVTVSDAGSYLSLTGGLEVGGAGDAVLTIQNGALVAASASGSGAGVAIAALGGSSTLRVTGAGSQLTDSGLFQVGGNLAGGLAGANGNGTLVVSGGAGVVVHGTGAGVLMSANGNLAATVTGAGSTWTIDGALTIGTNGAGSDTLTVAAGGAVTAGAVLLDTASGGAAGGTILVTGAGSSLDASSLTVGTDAGQSKTGALVVQAGGVVSASGSIFIYGTASLSAGTLSAGGTLTVDHLSSVSGSGTLQAAAIVNLGTISVGSGTLSCLGAVSGLGSVAISGNAALVLGSTLGASQIVDFGSGGGSLVASAVGDVAGTIAGWSAGDVIDLTSTAATSESFANGTLSLFGSGSQLLGALKFSGTETADNFTLTALAGGGTAISYHG